MYEMSGNSAKKKIKVEPRKTSLSRCFLNWALGEVGSDSSEYRRGVFREVEAKSSRQRQECAPELGIKGGVLRTVMFSKSLQSHCWKTRGFDSTGASRPWMRSSSKYPVKDTTAAPRDHDSVDLGPEAPRGSATQTTLTTAFLDPL